MTITLLRSADFDAETLLSAVRNPTPRLDAGSALALLAVRCDTVATQTLRTVLADTGRPDSLRALAATLLGSTGEQSAEGALIETLSDASERVLIATVKALGRIGARPSLAAVSALACDAKGRLARLAALSALLIAAREGLAAPGLETLPCGKAVEIDPDCAIEALVRSASREDVGDAIEALTSEPIGIDFALGPAQRIFAEGFEWMLLLNDAVVSGASCGEGQRLIGCITEWDASDDFWHHLLVFVAGPPAEDGNRRLALIAGSGDIAFDGRTRGARFDMNTVSDVALPARITGAWTPQGPTIESFVYLRQHAGRRAAPVLAESRT
ncbi:MAG: HEAT repeat domain-containing protein [Pseudomonadota bacterium]